MRLFTKRALAVLLSVLMLFSVAVPVFAEEAAPEAPATASTLYLQVSENWASDGARFAAYFFESGETWVDATAVDGQTNVYSVTVPEGEFTKVIFCRMNPESSDNNWDNRWTQSADLDIPTNGKNCYVVAVEWDAPGVWGTYADGVITTDPTEPTSETESTVPGETTVALMGTLSDWETGLAMTGADGVYTTTVTLDAGEYKFKIKVNDTWLGNNGVMEDTTAGAENGWEMTEAGDCTLNATGGDYTFTFNTTTNMLIVTKDGETAETTAPTETPTLPEAATIYVVNTADWETVNAYAWVGGSNNAWPGEAMTKVEGVTAPSGKDVYSFTYTTAYEKVVFNNGTDEGKTGDLTINAGQYFNIADSVWYAKLEEIPAEITMPTEPSEAKTYTVVGTANLCGGEGWDPTNTANAMTDEDGDGIFTKVYENVAAGEYEVKVAVNGAWDEAYPADNYKFTVNTGATVTVTINTADNSVNVAIEGDKQLEPVSGTVNFVNSVEWAAVKVHFWNVTDEADKNEWPGTDGTLVDGTTNVYSFAIENKTHLVFNDGGDANKTADIKVADAIGKFYGPKTKMFYATVEEALAAETAPAPENIVYMYNSKNWASVKVHIWNGTMTTGSTWPGNDATVVDAAKAIYSYNIGDSAMFIFNNGEGDQSSDLNAVDGIGKYYGPKTMKFYDNYDACKAAEDVFVEPEYEYFVVGNPELIPGGWSTTPRAATALEMYSDGVRRLVLTDVKNSLSAPEGIHQFKVMDKSGVWYPAGIDDETELKLEADGGVVVITFKPEEGMCTAAWFATLAEANLPEKGSVAPTAPISTEPVESTAPTATDATTATDPTATTATDPTVTTATEPTEGTQPATKAPAKTTVTLKKAKATVYVTGKTTIKVTVKNSKKKTTFKSSNTKVATVNAKGVVTAKKAGKAVITVTNNGVSKKFTVTVKKPTLNKSKLTIKKGKKFTLKITGKVGKATFKVDKKKVATVNKSGKITAKKPGKATITVKTNGITLKCKVTVKK